MKRRLLDEVSVNELLEFRNEGYTNAQIAEMLDVSSMTIYRIIGKMPKELKDKAMCDAWEKSIQVRREKKRMAESGEQTKGEGQMIEIKRNACLVLVNRKETLKGTIGLYEIDCENKKVTMRPVEEIEFDKLNDYINELQAISSRIGQTNVGKEMW